METALSTISILPESQQQSLKFAQMLTAEILDGNINPLRADLHLKIIVDCFTKVRDNIKEAAIKEAEIYGEKQFEFNGCNITLTGKTTIDYKGCWSKYDTLKEQLKQTEDFLKNLQTGIADSETGEEIKMPLKKYSPYLKIEFPKK
jgi:hypothetical protein